MLPAFLIIRSNHPQSNVPPETDFRLQLLRCLTLYCRRLERDHTTPAMANLTMLRNKHASQASAWTKSYTGDKPNMEVLDRIFPSPLQTDVLCDNRDHTLQTLYGEDQVSKWAYEFYATELSVSLLDILPMFMSLSAAIFGDSDTSTITHPWMKLAGDFMLQAALEQYLVRGASGSRPAEQAFAWGYVQHALSSSTDAENIEHMIDTNDMFQDGCTGFELPAWTETRNKYANEVGPIRCTYVKPEYKSS